MAPSSPGRCARGVFYMFPLIRILCACVVLLAPAAFAQSDPLAGVGVVLMHGKGGRPSSNINGLASALKQQGAIVVTPSMAWAGSRGVVAAYDVTYEQALADVGAAVAQLRSQGARKIVVAGQSLGANAAIAYAARAPGGLAGVIALAPGHTPDRMRQPKIVQAVADARAAIAAGQGGARGSFPDSNQGQFAMVSGNTAAWYSYNDPNGTASMPKNAARLSLPFLYVVGTSDRIHEAGRGYIFARAKPNPKSRYVEVNAGHFDTPEAAKADVIAWLKTL
jgi:pimeloyl-ACP methyl ester carboxylesterase